MRLPKTFAIFLCGWVSVLSATEAVAQTIVFDNYNDVDPVHPFGASTFDPIPINSIPLQLDIDAANAFIPTDSGILTDVWLTVSLFTGKNELDVWLMDDAGGLPGQVMAAWHFSEEMDMFVEGGFANPPLHGTGDGTTFLAMGQQYWLAASSDPTAPDDPLFTGAGWNRNSIGDVGPVATRVDDGAWTSASEARGAFRVAVVPEPATLVMMLLGAVVLAYRRRAT